MHTIIIHPLQIEEQLVIILFSNEQSDFAIEQLTTLYSFPCGGLLCRSVATKIAVKAAEL